jgi:hypothetical protein
MVAKPEKTETESILNLLNRISDPKTRKVQEAGEKCIMRNCYFVLQAKYEITG